MIFTFHIEGRLFVGYMSDHKNQLSACYWMVPHV